MLHTFQNLSRLGRTTSGLVLTLLMSLGAQAQTNPARPDFLDYTQRWLDETVSKLSQTGDETPLRMEVAVGELDTRLRLAPCARVEPYLPVGTRLWGKSRIGLRCLEGESKWNVFLPVTIHAYGPAWVIKGNVLPGAVLNEGDAMEAEVDWAEETSPVVGRQSHWLGQVATRSLGTGQVLRQGLIKPATVFQAGAQVRVIAQGPGFQITSAGQALSAGIVGQSARVKMDNGRVMSGVVLDNRTVKLEI